VQKCIFKLQLHLIYITINYILNKKTAILNCKCSKLFFNYIFNNNLKKYFRFVEHKEASF